MNWNLLTNGKKRCIINKNQRRFDMKPRVFVSSTFYDLKYVREDLSNFIRLHDFEPILFENGDVGYTPGEKLEKSCYDAMSSADMAILIIGGNFGTESSETNDKDKKDNNSITQEEFITAVENNVPAFVFIDSKVSGEYDVYTNNESKISENPDYINFNAANDIRIFKFIKKIFDLKTISVSEFSKVSEIKDFLAKQWSDMFKQFLENQKQNKETDSIKKSINKLENVVGKMEIMMDAIGKSVLKESNEYETIKNRQRAQEICELLQEMITVHDTLDVDDYKRSEDLINMFIDMSDDFVKSNLTTDSINALNEIQFNKLLNEHIKSHINNYSFSLCFIAYEIIDLLVEINHKLKNSNIKKEIKKLLNEKFYNRMVIYGNE